MKITDEAFEAAWDAYRDAIGSDQTALRAGVEAACPHLIGDEDTSDGFHTFRELYRHRMLLTAALFTTWWRKDRDAVLEGFRVHKSWRHSDGEACFGGGWFIVMATLPTGQISYHYPAADWDLFDIREQYLADEFDGHTADQAAERLEEFLRG